VMNKNSQETSIHVSWLLLISIQLTLPLKNSVLY